MPLVLPLQDGYRWLFKHFYACDAIFERVEALWQQSVIRSSARHPGRRLLVSALLVKELALSRRRRPDMVPFLERTLAELWKRRDVDESNLLLNLGLAEYVNQLPQPSRSFARDPPA